MDHIVKDPVDACYKVTKSLASRKSSFITVIYGSDVTEEQAQAAFEKINKKFGSDNCEVQLINGGQPVYYFIISVE